ncbi:3-oxoacyl-[acyl-carrier protein] reductase [Rubellimicrobium mesophilum DSM 19309]|uniref:3-oxoacyl-[acyl-carrier protein] reductase n=1 Tax=Rubellimicrobium mesophilum DSM 19309 TaxID=442562 RepID=A0A017HML1_9RHOB|nr:SDR family oxidoreductase [Rubellimicrobium mesophilum]EYD75530.1 3-oxoacyl-[acyl-carrier protein] reductase [Rubellimicrobium mesophilum DSM 19309]
MPDGTAQFGLPGRLALVTGGAKGIGAAIARTFAAAGARVVVADIDEAGGRALAEELGGIFLRLDVTAPDEVEVAAKRLATEVGVPDVVVANAGIVHNAPSAELRTADWSRVLDVNLTGVFHTCRAFGAGMVERGSGSVVCVSSMCGEIVVWPQPQAAYNAAKAGVNLLAKSLAVEWAAQGVRVNAIAPGYTATELTLAGRSRPEWYGTWIDRTPIGRLGEPQEIANCALFLASDASSFVTGTVLTVDGGYTAL